MCFHRPSGLGLVAPIWKPLLDASVLRACTCLLSTKGETRTLRTLAPAWFRSSWLTSRGPREVCLALISLPLVSLPGEAAPEEVLRRPPRDGLECLVDEDGSYGPASSATLWAAGRQVWEPLFLERRHIYYDNQYNKLASLLNWGYSLKGFWLPGGFCL